MYNRLVGEKKVGGWCNFFFNDTATTEIYTLSLHDALPISSTLEALFVKVLYALTIGYSTGGDKDNPAEGDRRRSEEHTSELQSHSFIPYAVFCLKKKR